MYNLNIERAVLSSIIFDPEIYEDVVSKLKYDDFYLPFHQHIFEAMLELNREEKPIDEEFIKSKLNTKGKYDEISMLELISSNPISNTKAYIEEIKAKSNKRAITSLATEIKKVTIEDDLPINDIMNLVEKKLYQITQDASSEEFKNAKDMTLSMLDEIYRLKEIGNSKLIGVDTGFRNLNDKTSGFGKGDLVIIAARPAMGKCLGKGTNILMHSGELKKIENIVVGDELMGDDSSPRKVLSLARGREEMYWVRQNKGIDYRVNKSHILSLKRSRNEGKHKHGDILNIEISDYIKKSDTFKKNYKGYKVAVDFAKQKLDRKAYTFGRRFFAEFKENNEFIPQNYLLNNRKNRMALLTGLMDEKGKYSHKKPQIKFKHKSKALAKQIKFLADSLGLRTVLKAKTKHSKVYALRIIGDISTIPSKKKSLKSLPLNKDYQKTKIKVKYDKVDDYYGFEIDGNKLFLLEDMTVTHNTSLVLNMTLKAIERDEGVAFFSLEMPSDQLMLRLLSTKTSIPLQKLRVGDLTDEQWSQLSTATSEISTKKLFVDDGGYATIHHIRSRLRKLKSKEPDITMAIIDYLQLMSGEGKEGRQQEVSEISRGLKQLARELEIPIIALSQLNRGVESRDNKRPMLSDLRESGSIEQDADIVMFVYRDDVYREAMEKEKEMKAKAEGKEFENSFTKKEEEDVELIIGKQRNGPTGTVDLIFQKRFTRFVDANKDEQPFVIEYEDDMISGFDNDMEIEYEIPSF